VDKAPRSGMQPIQSGSAQSAHSAAQISSLPQNVRRLLVRPAKRLQSDILHIVEYFEDKANLDKDGQQRIETVPLSDDSCDKYQNSHLSDETELDTETDTDENNRAGGTATVPHHQP